MFCIFYIRVTVWFPNARSATEVLAEIDNGVPRAGREVKECKENPSEEDPLSKAWLICELAATDGSTKLES